MEENYYEILEVNKNASPEIIEKAYKTLVKKYHPDLQEDNLKNIYEEKIKKINEAYDILSNSEKRKNYDLNLNNTIISSDDYNNLINENINLKKEINYLKEKLQEKGIELSLVESWEKGGEGATDLAEKVVKLAEKEHKFKYAYELNESIKNKIEDVAKKIYGAESVEFSEEAEKEIEKIEKLGYGNMPVCIAKTQYSLSDDQKNLECNEPFSIHIREIHLRAGAEFVVAIAGKIMTMPGLPKMPAAEKIDLDEDGNIVGIF